MGWDPKAMEYSPEFGYLRPKAQGYKSQGYKLEVLEARKSASAIGHIGLR